RAAVSSTALNFCCELQPSVVADALGSKRPVLRACLRQLYIVTVEMPSSAARSLTVRLYGASSLANMASRRSGEYFMGTFSLPQVGDSNSNTCRGSNYSDSGGEPARCEVLDVGHRIKQVVSEPVIANRAVIPFDIGVLLRLAGLNKLQFDMVLFSPAHQCRTCVFRAIVSAE